MRVHPSQLRPPVVGWQMPTMILLILVTVVSQFFTQGSEENPKGTSVSEVWIATQDIQSSEIIDVSKLALVKRRSATLPSDAISDIEQLIGQIAAGPIPAGYPLAKTLLRSEQEKLPRARQTVLVAIPYVIPPPPDGTRVAVTLQGADGATVLVADEAWIESREGNIARVGFKPETALLFEKVKSLGTVSYLVLGDSNPFSGQAIEDLESIKQQMGLVKTQFTPEPIVQKSPQPSYAWIKGDRVVYTVAPTGSIYVLDNEGEVQPLFQYRLRLPQDFYEKDTSRSRLSWEDE